jgi:hypothetical protein
MNPTCSFCGQPKLPMVPGRGDKGIFICGGCVTEAGRRLTKVRGGALITKSALPVAKVEAPVSPRSQTATVSPVVGLSDSFTEREQAARARGEYAECGRIEQERRAAFFARVGV